jgi:dienelactone hydrolase
MEQHRIVVTRRARYYSLGELSGAREVWIVLHGYGQLAEEFLAAFGVIAQDGRAVVAPEALNRFYKSEPAGSAGGGGAAAGATHARTPVGTTWMTRADREAEIADYVDYLDAVADAVGGAGRRLVALGFSQGVATVVRWVALGRTRVERVVLWAGSLPADLDLMVYAGRFPSGATDVVQGTRDEFSSWANLDEQRRRLREAGIQHVEHSFDGGHRLDRATLMALVNR